MNLLIYIGIRILAGVIIVVFHEAVKSLAAYYATHPIYRQSVKPNTKLHKYIDPIGLLMFVFMRVVWQKPFHYRTSRFTNKAQGMMLVSVVGILSNILLISVLIPVFGYIENGYVSAFVYEIIFGSVAITVINLLPIPPFDMSVLLKQTSPTFGQGVNNSERLLHVVFIAFITTGFCLMMVHGIMTVLNPFII